MTKASSVLRVDIEKTLKESQKKLSYHLQLIKYDLSNYRQHIFKMIHANEVKCSTWQSLTIYMSMLWVYFSSIAQSISIIFYILPTWMMKIKLQAYRVIPIYELCQP